MTDDPNGRTALYRFFDRDSALLYVGISRHPKTRWKQHEDDKPWWSQVADTRIDWFDTREQAALAEQRAIREEHPAYNSQRDARRVALITPRAPRAARTSMPRPDGGDVGSIVEARAAYDEARSRLFAAIRAALADGVGPSRIARCSDFTREYIAKIRDGKGPKGV